MTVSSLSLQLLLIVCSPFLHLLPDGQSQIQWQMFNLFEGLHLRFRFQFLFQPPMLKTITIYFLAVLQSRLSSTGQFICWFNLRSLCTGSSISRSPRAKWSKKARATWHQGLQVLFLSSLSHGLFWRITCFFYIVVAMFQESNHQRRSAYQASGSTVLFLLMPIGRRKSWGQAHISKQWTLI